MDGLDGGRWMVVGCLVAVGCNALAEDAGEGQSDASSTSDEGQDDASSTSDDGQDADPSLEVCAELPAAALTGWREGPREPSTATSTAARMRAAGEQTWTVALDMLRFVDPDAYPSIAAAPTSLTISGARTVRRVGENDNCAPAIIEQLGFTESGDALHQTLGAALREFAARALPAEDGADPVAIGMQQSSWDVVQGGSAGAVLESDPVYGGASFGISTVDGAELDAVREVVNCVIEQQSGGVLVDFLPEGKPSPDVESFEIDVTALQAPWAAAWEENGTMPFTRDDGTSVELAAIRTPTSYALYAAADGFSVVGVPLRGGELVVMLVLPDPAVYESLGAFSASLTGEALATVRSGASYVVADIRMPIVDIEPETIDYANGDPRCTLPLTDWQAFSGARVRMDDKGIEAVAATVSEEDNDTGSGPPEVEVTLELDHPFLFFVYDDATQFVLFSGRYAG